MILGLELQRGSDILILLGAAACTASLVYLINGFVINRKRLRGVERSPTPGEARPSSSEKNNYTSAFPPLHKLSFSDLGPGIAEVKTVDLAATPRPLMRLDSDFRRCDPALFNYTGFSVADIRSLGNFPDYAKLSGVPLPKPLVDFNVDEALPRPYRPFRWAYHQTMSLSKMDTDFWIELENTYRARIAERQGLFKDNGRHVLESLPGSELACKELMEMVLQFIVARYPNQFSLQGCVLTNNILGTETDLSKMAPLEVLLHNVPEDFGIMLRDPETGRYVLRAGMICSSVGWKLSEKMGMGLPGIHTAVPDYKEKMEFSMDRFFTKMPTDKPIQRGSWGLEVGQPLYIPAEHPDFAHRSSQNSTLKPDDVYLRVDWQTLRRLPVSGAVVFNFKALFTPIIEFKSEPYIPSLILKVLNEGKENILKYKGTWHVEHVAKPALRDYERFQVETGMIEEDWSVQTLAEAPFFRGWEKKWRHC